MKIMNCVQNALKSAHDRSIAEHLTASDRALLWLCYIHLTEFDRLPSVLYDLAESGPSRLVSRKSFLLPWRSRQDVSTPPDILIALFQGTASQHDCSCLRSSSSGCLGSLFVSYVLVDLYFRVSQWKSNVFVVADHMILKCLYLCVPSQMPSISAVMSLCLSVRGRWPVCPFTPTSSSSTRCWTGDTCCYFLTFKHCATCLFHLIIEIW